MIRVSSDHEFNYILISNSYIDPIFSKIINHPRRSYENIHLITYRMEFHRRYDTIWEKCQFNSFLQSNKKKPNGKIVEKKKIVECEIPASEFVGFC